MASVSHYFFVCITCFDCFNGDWQSYYRTHKTNFNFFFTPVVSVLSKPVDWIKQGGYYLQNWAITYRENERLKAENEYLLKWRSLALELSAEQKELKEYLKYVPPPKTRHLMAEILLDEGSAYTRSFVVSAGFNQGVQKGMLAFSPKGLFARVVEVMPNYSRVMALTDN